MRKAVLATITILLLSGMAQAQEAGTPAPPPSPLRLTLNDAIERALATAPRMDQLRAIERAAQADVDGALALRWPSIETQAGYTRNSNVPELILNLPGSAPRTLFPNIPDNLRARLNASLTLYSGGRIDGLVTAARREADAQAHDARTERQDLALETRAAYWSLASARAMAVVYREGIDAYESHLKDARNRERVGLAARNEVMAVTVERDRALLARLKADNLIRLTEANLGRL
ncbi:MAG: TolC family protein, partial [Vicinamibacteria bacterium]|nr:TolC family protein [Vicinamibacteria bacterium]